MNNVAAECGTSKPHLYHYFTSKEGLLFGIVREHIEDQSDELNAIMRQPLPAEQSFTQFVASFVKRAAHSRNEHLSLMNDLKHLRDTERNEINPQLMAQVRVQAPMRCSCSA
jgi:AcrR family transcriptional regulator